MNSIVDDNLTVAQPCGPQRISLPFSSVGDQTTILIEQDYWQFFVNFAPLAVNSQIIVGSTTCYLIEETPLMPAGVAGVARWTRKYAAIPQPRSEGSSMAYKFVGLSGAVVGGVFTLLTQRTPQTWTASCRIQYQFFLLGAPSSYLTFRQIPITLKQRYYFQILYGYTAPVSASSHLPIGTETTTLTSGASTYPSTPTTETYLGWVSAGTEIVAEDSTVSKWKGNIYQVVTKYLTAQ